MSPIAKFFSTCLNETLTQQAAEKGWQTEMQAGFRPRYRLEDLVFPVDYLLSSALTEGTGLGLCFIDLEKAFDTLPRAKLIPLLLHHYRIAPDLVE